MVEQRHVALRILRRRHVEKLTGYARSTLYDHLDPKSPRFDPRFPQPIKLSPNGSAVGWLEHEIEAWIESRINATRRKGENTTI